MKSFPPAPETQSDKVLIKTTKDGAPGNPIRFEVTLDEKGQKAAQIFADGNVVGGFNLYGRMKPGSGKGKGTIQLADHKHDLVAGMVIEVDLDIHNGQDGLEAVREKDEEDVGAVTVANLNDTDGDGKKDKDDKTVKAGAEHPGQDEVDLMQLVVHKPNPDGGGKVTLKVKSGAVRLWEKRTKEKEVELVGGEVKFKTADLKKTLWVEATAVSGAPQDIVLELEYKGCTDTVKATAIWVDKTARSPWRIRERKSGLPNNPDPDKDLPDLDDEFVILRIADRKAADGSRYGHGFCRAKDGVDTYYGGRILHEFKIQPAGVDALGVTFDVTRQIQARGHAIVIGQGTLVALRESTFPWLQTPVRGPETPNDDGGTLDEDNEPDNMLVYSWDAPRRTSLEADNLAFTNRRTTFKEWVRVRLDGKAISHEALPGAPPGSGLRKVQGSRASDKEDWHMVYYLKRNALAKLEEDNAATSFCAPVFKGRGNGPCAISLLADAGTEGFTATYDEPKKKWTLTGTIAGHRAEDTQDPAPAGTQWTLTIGAKVKVVITQGATAFRTGDSFKFSVFKTSAPGGKKNETNTGFFDVTAGP